jgi:hypothetical protein
MGLGLMGVGFRRSELHSKVVIENLNIYVLPPVESRGEYCGSFAEHRTARAGLAADLFEVQWSLKSLSG